MVKFFTYFIQSIIIYIFFILGKIMGITLSRKLFSYLFLKIGHNFKSKKLIESNLNIYSKSLTEIKRDELMSMEIVKKNINLATIYRPLNNYFLNPFMEFLRRKYVCKNQIKKGVSGVREAIEYLKKGYSIALMIDQRVSEGEKINFFGKSALTTTLPAQLALKFDLPIIPVFIERDQNDNFKIKFYQEINPKSFNDKSTLTDKLNKVIEEMIICRPEGWIWTHNRWK